MSQTESWRNREGKLDLKEGKKKAVYTYKGGKTEQGGKLFMM